MAIMLGICLLNRLVGTEAKSIYNLAQSSQDLAFIYHNLQDNHPGFYNKEDALFVPTLEKYNLYAQKLSEAKTAQERVAVVKAYVKEFNDIHVDVFYDDPNLSQSTENSTSHNTSSSPSLTSTASGVTWIRLPSFELSSPGDVEKMQKIITTLPSLRENKAIIFDLRGNIGGEMAWVPRITLALFGYRYGIYHLRKILANTHQDFRASYDNCCYMKQLHEDLVKKFGETSAEAEWCDSLSCAMEDAYNNKEPYYQQWPIAMDEENEVVPKNPVKAKIIVIVDRYCVSASLLFIDSLKAMGYPIHLVGEKTNADTVYTNVRRVELPSEKGIVIFPIQLTHNRVRGSNIPYTPTVAYEKNLHNTALLKKFVLSHYTGWKNQKNMPLIGHGQAILA
jgi:hypothetical protein